MKGKIESKLHEDKMKKEMEKEIIHKYEQDKLMEVNDKIKRKMENKQVFDQQLQQAKLNENLKRQFKRYEIEEGKKYVEKYESLLDNKDKERLDLKLSIIERAKIRDLREAHSTNVKKLQEIIDVEYDNKFIKEKEELEKKYEINNKANINFYCFYFSILKMNFFIFFIYYLLFIL